MNSQPGGGARAVRRVRGAPDTEVPAAGRPDSDPLVARPEAATDVQLRGHRFAPAATEPLAQRARPAHDAPAAEDAGGTGTAGRLAAATRETRALHREIEQLKEAQTSIERQALSDGLTGLANRTLLADRLSQSLRRLKRSPGFVGVLMLDLDHFKVINDTLGHQVGDAVLVEAAKRLGRLARPEDTVARFGGDEFVVVVQGIDNTADLTAFAERIVSGLRKPYRIGTEEVVATVSIGIAVASRPEVVARDLLREADMAMYRAKAQGRDRHEVYGASLQVLATERLEMERVLRRALVDDCLLVEYQPIVDLVTGATVQAEALLRINDVDRGRLMPSQFLAVAAETALLPAIDERMRQRALRDLAGWRATPGCAIHRMALNLTARELSDPDFASNLSDNLQAVGLDGGDLSLEVTEQVLMQTSHSAVASLSELRALGAHIGLDDFGTGFSALSYLQDFPLDFLKIDRSFVSRIGLDSRSASIIPAIIGLAHGLGLTVVAEGVETEEQLSSLRTYNCDLAQGFLFSASVSSTEFCRLIGPVHFRAV